MIATIQVYIHIRKGVEVKINKPTTVHEQGLLFHAYGIATSWLEANNVNITRLS